jgi:protein-disulfide isomerase
MILAILSGTDLCNFGGCTTAHQYRFFGFKLHLLGILYFSALGGAVAASLFFPALEKALPVLIAGGAGAEITMIHLQKNVIQAWCPLCLGIAAVVGLLSIIVARKQYLEARRSSLMNFKWFAPRFLLLAVACAAGFLVSFYGITNPEATAAGQPDVYLGKQVSKVEVYVFSDWLCPVCVMVEPAVEAAFPELAKKTKIFFLDKPVHPEAMNFVPYHLSFLVNEKPKYLKLRHALFALAKKTKNPSIADVNAAIAPLGVTYKQLSFMEVSQLMGQAQSLSGQFKVNATPTIVISNVFTKKSKTLVGGKDITKEKLLEAVKSLE